MLLDAERAGNPVVAIAPGLKATSKAVKLALGSPRAMSFACYLPEGGDAEKIAVSIAREQGLRFITHFIRLRDMAHLKANRLPLNGNGISGLEVALVNEFERAVREHILTKTGN